MSAAKLAKLIGATATYSPAENGLMFDVKIVDVKESYGRTRYKIEDSYGRTAWVEKLGVPDA